MAYLDSVASRGEEGWLMNRWGWWKFPPELTRQGGAAIKLQNKVLEMCGENRGVRLYPEIEEKSFRINRHAVRCILSRMFYNIILIAQETEKGRYELFWTAIYTPYTFNYLHTRELTKEEWNTFHALLEILPSEMTDWAIQVSTTEQTHGVWSFTGKGGITSRPILLAVT